MSSSQARTVQLGSRRPVGAATAVGPSAVGPLSLHEGLSEGQVVIDRLPPPGFGSAGTAPLRC